jgi:hypothetical protein
MKVEQSFNANIMVYSPPTVDVVIGAGVSVAANIKGGYDTFGISQARAQNKW